jgi:hypothetical protein
VIVNSQDVSYMSGDLSTCDSTIGLQDVDITSCCCDGEDGFPSRRTGLQFYYISCFNKSTTLH